MFLIPITRCIINVTILRLRYLYVCFLVKKKPHNESDDNYYRGESHKPLFEDLPIECGGETVTVRYMLISK